MNKLARIVGQSLFAQVLGFDFFLAATAAVHRCWLGMLRTENETFQDENLTNSLTILLEDNLTRLGIFLVVAKINQITCPTCRWYKSEGHFNLESLR